MGKSDIFNSERVELLDGEIWRLGRQSPLHAATVSQTSKAIRGILIEEFVVSIKMPISLTDVSEPDSDVSVAMGTVDDFAGHHPSVSELILLVEAADDTLEKDRGIKRKIYASAGIRDYWIVNFVNRQIEVYRKPIPSGTYAEATIHFSGQLIFPLGLPTKAVAVSDLLPPVQQL